MSGNEPPFEIPNSDKRVRLEVQCASCDLVFAVEDGEDGCPGCGCEFCHDVTNSGREG